MHLRYLGYACQNLSMPCTTGRTFRLANLSPARAKETTAENLSNLLRILKWNRSRGIRFFRISSDVVPFASHADYELDWQRVFTPTLAEIRAYVQEHDLRLTMHPGQYTVLNSPRPEVVEASLRELEYQAAFIDAVDPELGTLTLHVGGAYGDKATAKERFEANFDRLSPLAQQKLALENDDRTYHLADVLPLCETLGVPLIFDYFHHRCHHADATVDAGLLAYLERVVATWNGRIPKFHLSSRRPGSKTSHADLIEADDFAEFVGVMDQVEGGAYDLMLEAKKKEQAVLAFTGSVAAS